VDKRLRCLVISFLLVLLFTASYKVGKEFLEGDVPEPPIIPDQNTLNDLTALGASFDTYALDSVEVKSWTPRILLYSNFISNETADYIINIGRDLVTRSLVVDNGAGNAVSDGRTSYGTFLMGPLARDPVVLAIQKKKYLYGHNYLKKMVRLFTF